MHRQTMHWRAPTTMLGSFAIAVALAAGHHALYASLAGTEVVSDPTVIAGFDVASQQLYTAGGTSFAFLVKAMLAVSVSTAYVQVMWRTAFCKATAVSTLDALFDVLASLLSLVRVQVWWRYPLLFMLALSFWYVHHILFNVASL